MLTLSVPDDAQGKNALVTHYRSDRHEKDVKCRGRDLNP